MCCVYVYMVFTTDIYIYICVVYIYMVCTTDGFFEVATESWSDWDLNPRTLNSVAQTL